MSLGKFRPEGPFETRLFINNEFVPAVSAKTFPTFNPATEKLIAEVAVSCCYCCFSLVSHGVAPCTCCRHLDFVPTYVTFEEERYCELCWC